MAEKITSWKNEKKIGFSIKKKINRKTNVTPANLKTGVRYLMKNVSLSCYMRHVKIRTNSGLEEYWTPNGEDVQSPFRPKDKNDKKFTNIYCAVEGHINQFFNDTRESVKNPNLSVKDLSDISFWIGNPALTVGDKHDIAYLYTNFAYTYNTSGERAIHCKDAKDNTWVEFLSLPKKNKANSLSLHDVILPDNTISLLKAGMCQITHNDLIFDTWGFDEVFEKGTAIAFLLWGPPGTGKTLACQAISNELGLTLQVVQSGEVWSSEPGGAERTIKAYFQDAEQNKKFLLFDECDSLIADRNEVGMILGAQVNALLSALENYKGVCGFTTNRLGHMDAAFERRVSIKIEFPFPDQTARLAIWRILIPTKAPIDKDVDFEILSQFPIAGGNIKNVILNAARMAAFLDMKTINMDCFLDAIEKEGESMQKFETAINSQPKIGMIGPGAGMKVDERGGLVLKNMKDKMGRPAKGTFIVGDDFGKSVKNAGDNNGANVRED